MRRKILSRKRNNILSRVRKFKWNSRTFLPTITMEHIQTPFRIPQPMSNLVLMLNYNRDNPRLIRLKHMVKPINQVVVRRQSNNTSIHSQSSNTSIHNQHKHPTISNTLINPLLIKINRWLIKINQLLTRISPHLILINQLLTNTSNQIQHLINLNPHIIINIKHFHSLLKQFSKSIQLLQALTHQISYWMMINHSCNFSKIQTIKSAITSIVTAVNENDFLYAIQSIIKC